MSKFISLHILVGLTDGNASIVHCRAWFHANHLAMRHVWWIKIAKIVRFHSKHMYLVSCKMRGVGASQKDADALGKITACRESGEIPSLWPPMTVPPRQVTMSSRSDTSGTYTDAYAEYQEQLNALARNGDLPDSYSSQMSVNSDPHGSFHSDLDDLGTFLLVPR